MALDETRTGYHIPKNSMLFEFDEEVISVFDNMASRSIVGYKRAYELLTHLFNRVSLPRYTQVWDMGTTTGKGLHTVRAGRRLDPYIDYWACDISEASVKVVGEKHPWANTMVHDFRDGLPSEIMVGKVSAMIWGYTLQFLESQSLRKELLRKSYEAMCPGGVLVVLEKFRLEDDFFNDLMQDAYITFRRENGYTLEEIGAKTQALSNSMWPTSPEFMESALREAGFKNIQVLYRDLNFGGFVAFR